MKKSSVRFHVERRVGRGPSPSDDVWTRETLAGAKTITGARRDRSALGRESPGWYFKRGAWRIVWRIVKITTTTEVVT